MNVDFSMQILMARRMTLGVRYPFQEQIEANKRPEEESSAEEEEGEDISGDEAAPSTTQEEK